MKAALVQAVWWCAWLAFCALFLYFAFRFDVLSARHWHMAGKYGFHGLRGTALLISLAAALPIGAAMSFLFWKQKGFAKPAKPEETKPVEHLDAINALPEIEINKDMPDELKNAYVKMKRYAAERPAEPVARVAPKKTERREDDLFAMDDFDPAPDKKPVAKNDGFDFKPITFGSAEPEQGDDIKIVETDDEIRVVAEHKDEGAWVAEEKSSGGLPPQWFTEGAQKISPAYLARAKADEIKSKKSGKPVVAVLKITTDNIINKKDMFSVWEEMGVKVE